jgi:hypothetical protein
MDEQGAMFEMICIFFSFQEINEANDDGKIFRKNIYNNLSAKLIRSAPTTQIQNFGEIW